MRCLLLGAGNSRVRKIRPPQSPEDFGELTTLDIDPSTGCDVVHDLNVLPYPFADGEFDEIHAYEVLEHCGRQGDWKFFFDQFAEFYRMLKPEGLVCFTVPMWNSEWAWGDPGHTRVITPGSLIFLDREQYKQIGKSSMTDYRPWLRCDFEIGFATDKDGTFCVVLVKR